MKLTDKVFTIIKYCNFGTKMKMLVCKVRLGYLKVGPFELLQESNRTIAYTFRTFLVKFLPVCLFSKKALKGFKRLQKHFQALLLHFKVLKKEIWYFVTIIVLTYCEKKLF